MAPVSTRQEARDSLQLPADKSSQTQPSATDKSITPSQMISRADFGVLLAAMQELKTSINQRLERVEERLNRDVQPRIDEAVDKAV